MLSQRLEGQARSRAKILRKPGDLLGRQRLFGAAGLEPRRSKPGIEPKLFEAGREAGGAALAGHERTRTDQTLDCSGRCETPVR